MKKGAAAVALVLLPLPLAGLGFLGLWFWRRYMQRMLEQLVKDAMKPRIARWAPELAAAGAASYPMRVGGWQWTKAFCSIIDRESGGGVFLDPQGPDGTGDQGHGHGLGQVDDRDARPDRSDYEKKLAKKRLEHIASGDWRDPARHLRFCAVEVFRGAWDEFAEIDDIDERLEAAVASYNAGVDNVRNARKAGWPVDSVTTNKNYSADVLSGRAELA